VSRRSGCRGTVTVRVVGPKGTLGTRTVRLRRNCRFRAVGALSAVTMQWAITIRFNGNRVLLPRLVGPRSLP
jgi:hypothetical protein